MKLSKRVKKYAQENFNGVLHTTFNPDGPGVVRIHLIPPVVEDDEIAPSVVILNGQDIIPVGPSWTILLCEFINEVNKYAGQEINEQQAAELMKQVCKNMHKVYPLVPSRYFRNDVADIMDAFTKIAYGEEANLEITHLSMGDYAMFMRAPHRMDLMISAMTKDNKWHCNQKCVHCYAAGQQQAEEAELSTEEWKKIIDACKEAGIPQVTFTGGEPTMRDDLVELVEHAAWFVTRLNTNGVKLTKELCEQLHAASLDSMQITFYSDNADIHNKLVGVEQYENTVKGIENALAAGISVSINTPLCTLNRDYLSTLKFLHEKGVMYVTCSGLITTGNATGRESEELQLTTEEIKAVLKDAVEYCFANDMEISFTSPGWIEEEYFDELGITKPTCGACLSNMAVTPGGNVVPCQSWLSDSILGSMLNDNWDSIWNSEECKKRRDYSAEMTGLCPLRRAK